MGVVLQRAAQHALLALRDAQGLTVEQRLALRLLREALAEEGAFAATGLCVIDSGWLMVVDPGAAEAHLRTGWYDRNIRDPEPGAVGAVRPISLDGEHLGTIVRPAGGAGRYQVHARLSTDGVVELCIVLERALPRR